MGAAKKTTGRKVDEKLLGRFLPFQSLDLEQCKMLAQKCQLLTYPADRVIFRRGDNDRCTYFLVAGEIEISSRSIGLLRLKADTEAAREAIADVRPRRVEMRTTRPTTLLVIDRHLLEVMEDSDLAANYQVAEVQAADPGDWLAKFLGSLNTGKIPPRNIQALLLRMKEIVVRPGQVLIRQNDADDHYYIIKEGRCLVTRQVPGEGEVTLAELGVGAGFGEEALITKGQRNASVRMLDSGVVLRLAKQDFLDLVVRPAVDLVTYAEAEEMVVKGGRFIDVRDHATRQDFLESALWIPMSALRQRLPGLSRGQTYVVFCNNGQLSPAAAFLLSQHGYDAYVLIGGIQRVPEGAELLQKVRLGAEPETLRLVEAVAPRQAAQNPGLPIKLKNMHPAADIDSDAETAQVGDLAGQVAWLRRELQHNQEQLNRLARLLKGQEEKPQVVVQQHEEIRRMAEGLQAMSQRYAILDDRYNQLLTDFAALKSALGNVAHNPASMPDAGRQSATRSEGGNRGGTAGREDAFVEAIKSWTSELERQLTDSAEVTQNEPQQLAQQITSVPAAPEDVGHEYDQRRFTKKQRQLG